MPALPRRLLLGALSAGAATWALPVAAGVSPLPRAHRRALEAIPEDPAPGKLAADFNFVASNEKHLDRFRYANVAKGGIHVGVGTEQNYVLAGWFRPELLILMDFDARVVDAIGSTPGCSPPRPTPTRSSGSSRAVIRRSSAPSSMARATKWWRSGSATSSSTAVAASRRGSGGWCVGRVGRRFPRSSPIGASTISSAGWCGRGGSARSAAT